MAWLAAVGPWIGSNLGTIGSLVSGGLSLASQLGAFGGGGKSDSGADATAAALAAERKKAADEEADEEKKRKAFLAKLSMGKSGTILTSGKGLGTRSGLEQGILKKQLGA